MNPEIKAKWIERLRSGKYRQGKDYLKSTDRDIDLTRFCCLGVLCDMAASEGVVRVRTPEEEGWNSAWTFGKSETEVLPWEVMEWAGIDSPLGSLDNFSVNDERYANLAELNDGGFTFAEIADVIEKHF